ncbi:MAG TPA: permease [Ktedonobacterales bacterium]|nr:permease [Ktedonobacterales bacterium]
MGIISAIGQSLLAAFGMAWDVLWSLVLGFLISGMIQAYISRAKMSQALGKAGLKEVALAVGFGAASSSCSYAAIAAAKSMFKRGAHLIPALAFMFASTNLVIELGLVLWQLMGWQFAVAEWFGGVVLVAIMVALVKLTYPKRIVEEGRAHQEDPRVNAMDHGDELAPGRTLWEKLRSREGWVYVAHYVAMDWSMLWRDMIGGFLIAGFLAVVIPNSFWNSLFIQQAPSALRLVENAVVGPIIAIISFVCSVGNVPLAAILFSGGITFGGAISFLYADLIVLPILDIYRKYYGWRLAAYIAGVLFATMVVTGMLVDLLFAGLNRLFPSVQLIPQPNHHLIQMVEHISFNYTTILNIIALLLVGGLIYLNVKHPMRMGHDMSAMRELDPAQHDAPDAHAAHTGHAGMAEMDHGAQP